jgi:protein TonB
VYAIAAPPTVGPADRLGLTIFVAIVAHLLVILGISFTNEDRQASKINTLDVVLVQSRSIEAPDNAKLLAQANHEGGGDSTKPERPSTPLIAPFTAPTPAVAALPTAQLPTREVLSPQLEATQQKVTESDPVPPQAIPKPVVAQRHKPAQQQVPDKPEIKAERRQQLAKAKVPDAPEPKAAEAERSEARKLVQAPINANTLINQSLAMASLRATIDQQMKAMAERPRRKWISASTREHKFAAYMEAWRGKVERIGNLNYPDEARRRRLSGNLLLDVALKQDGTISDVVLRRSSGKKVLDDAAVRIVKLAAPYGKFPPSIAKEVDILHIERTWQFSTNNRFASR